MQDINELLLGNRSLAGVLNASAEIRGTRNDPVVQSDFAVTGGTVEGVKFNALTGKANYSGRAVDVDARLEQTPAAVLTAVGTIPVPEWSRCARTRTEEFDLAVKSTPIDIALFQPATTQLTKLAGQFSADVRVRGTLESPRLNGLVETTNGGFSVVATGVTYTNAIARLMFEGDRVLVDRFELSDDDRDRLVAIGELGIERRSIGRDEPADIDVAVQGARQRVRRHADRQRRARHRRGGEARSSPAKSSRGPARLEVDQILEQLSRNPYRTEATVATETEADAG